MLDGWIGAYCTVYFDTIFVRKVFYTKSVSVLSIFFWEKVFF